MIKVKRTVALVCIASVLILNGCDKRIPLYDKLAVAPVIQVSEQNGPSTADGPGENEVPQTSSTISYISTISRTSSRTSSRRTSTYSRRTPTYSRRTSTYSRTSSASRPSYSSRPAQSSERPTEPPTESAQLVNITVDFSSVGKYQVLGGTVDVSGIVVSANYDDGSVVVLDRGDYTVSGTRVTQLGENRITVEYEGLEVEFEYTAVRYIVAYVTNFTDIEYIYTNNDIITETTYGDMFGTPEYGDLTFRGWYTDEARETEAVFPIDLSDMAQNGYFTLYADWYYDDMFVTQDNGDGTFTVTGYTGTETVVTVPDVIIKSDGSEQPVSAIARTAFSGNEFITDIFIGASVSSIEQDAFLGCTALQNIIVSENNMLYQSKDGVLYTKEGDTLIAYPSGRTGPYTVPQYTATIGVNAFNGSAVSYVTIPESVMVIEDGAFRGSNVSVVWIESNSMLEEIGNQAFWDTEQLRYFVCLAEFPPRLESVLQNNSSGTTALEAVFVPRDNLADYRAAEVWCDMNDKLRSEEDIPDMNQITVSGE